jgi:hypothetical protein
MMVPHPRVCARDFGRRHGYSVSTHANTCGIGARLASSLGKELDKAVMRHDDINNGAKEGGNQWIWERCSYLRSRRECHGHDDNGANASDIGVTIYEV